MGFIICDGNNSDIHNHVSYACKVPGVPHEKHLIYERIYEGDEPPKGIKVHEMIEMLMSDKVHPDAEIVVRNRDYSIDTPLIEVIDGAVVIS